MKNNVLNNHHNITVKFFKWHHLFSAILVAITNLISVSLAHELEPEKMAPVGRQNILWSFSNLRYRQKYDELSELVAFGRKLRYFTDQSGLNVRPHKNEF